MHRHLEINPSVYSKKINQILWLFAMILPIVFIPLNVKFNVFIVIKGAVLFCTGVILFSLLILEKKWDKEPIIKVFLALLMCQFVASIFAFKPLLAFIGFSSNAGRFEGFVTLFSYGILFYAAKNHMVITKKRIITFFSSLTIISLYAFIQYLECDPMVIYWHFNKMVFSTIGNQNFLGSLEVILSILALCLFLKTKKWYYGLFFTIFFATLLMSQTRSAWIGFFMVFMLIMVSVLLFNRDKIKSFGIAVVLITITGLGLNALKDNLLLNRSNSIKQEFEMKSEFGGSGRIAIWKMTFNIVKNHPYLGAGPENLSEALSKEQKTNVNNYYKVKKQTVDRAHNEYLHIAAVSGIPALICYLVMLFLIITKNIKFIFKDKIQTALLFGVLGYLIQAFFNISVVSVAPIFWILLGLLATTHKDPLANSEEVIAD
jgi:putative inorganic carbon (HCO3(-)) transporter